MEKEKIDLYIQEHEKYFEPYAIPKLITILEHTDEETFLKLVSCDLKDPTAIQIVSIIFGVLGIDRFIIGDIGIAALKFLTLGCFGILWLIDIFTIKKKTRLLNLATISFIIDWK